MRALFQVKLITGQKSRFWDLCIMCPSEMVLPMPVRVLVVIEWLHKQRELKEMRIS